MSLKPCLLGIHIYSHCDSPPGTSVIDRAAAINKYKLLASVDS